MTYRVFIGAWNNGEPEWAHLDVGSLPWNDAKTVMLQHLARFQDDECGHCRDDAAKEFVRLQAAAPGDFEACVDGEDYVIVQEGT
jgi:hypothetical protein